MLLLSLKQGRKNLEKGYFYNADQLKSSFLPKLEEMLVSLDLIIPEENRKLAVSDLASFLSKKRR